MGKRKTNKKKQRKGKGFDSASNKRERDEVTGLYIDLDEFGILASDTVYGPDSEFIAALEAQVFQETGVQTESDSSYEFEFDANRLTITAKTTGSRNGYEYNTFQRALLEGRFNFDDGLLTSAIIESFSGHDVIFRGGELFHEYASVINFVAPRKVEDTRRIAPWNYAVGVEEGSTVEMEAQWTAEQSDYGDNYGRISDIYGKGGGKIFEAGWWDNPFNTNLI
jgi:hypothetical protein